MQELVQKFSARNVLVIGDAILDVYLTGTTDRLCREAPAPVVTLQEQVSHCGGAANTAANVAGLGGQCCFLTVTGRDESARELAAALESHGVDTGCMLQDENRITVAKRRISASSNILVRVDEGNTDPVGEASGNAMAGLLERRAGGADAVIVSDYGCGVITDALINVLHRLLRNRNVPLIVDARNPRRYRALQPALVKPNYEECLGLLGIPPRRRPERVAQISGRADALLAATGARAVAATLDADGVIVFEPGQSPYRIPCIPRNENRTIGAGDCFTACAALALCSGATARTAAELAATAASIVLEKEGTAMCSGEDLKAHFNAGRKLITGLDDLAVRAGQLRRAGRRIVFTNGCFDILHRGHVDFLKRARALGDVLVVGLNSDRSIRNVKGAGRPINSLEDRVEVLAGLNSVDYLIAFEERTPVAILEALKPNVFAKGATYTEDSVPEGELVRRLGGEVRIIPFTNNLSTTRLIERIQTSPSADQGGGRQHKVM